MLLLWYRLSRAGERVIAVDPGRVKLLRNGFSRISYFLKLGFAFVLQLLALD